MFKHYDLLENIIRSFIPEAGIYRIEEKEYFNTLDEEQVFGGGGGVKRIDEVDGLNISFRNESDNNLVILLGNTKFIDCRIEMLSNNTVIIGYSKNIIRNLKISFLKENSGVYIDRDFSSSDVKMTLKGKNVYIGKDCMFSNGINILTSDMHTVTDLNGKTINYPENVYIGNHVWIGQNVELLKGVWIPDNCIVGAGSVVTSKFIKGNCVIAGNPARIKKENISWNRKGPEII